MREKLRLWLMKILLTKWEMERARISEDYRELLYWAITDRVRILDRARVMDFAADPDNIRQDIKSLLYMQTTIFYARFRDDPESRRHTAKLKVH